MPTRCKTNDGRMKKMQQITKKDAKRTQARQNQGKRKKQKKYKE